MGSGVISGGHTATLRRLRRALLEARTQDGHWEGVLSSSALSTATAVVALALMRRDTPDPPADDGTLVRRGIAWLIAHQNDDGGWGDTDRSFSNISTTALGWAALAVGGTSDELQRAEERAAGWLSRAAGGTDPVSLANAIVARYGKDRTFSVPILTMCALCGRLGTGRAAWRLIPQLPFELAIVPRHFFTVISLPVVSYALPALIAMGLARHRQHPSRNPLARAIRDGAVQRSLRVLESLQPPNGGFLEAAPLTSFVTMTLVAAGHGQHAVAARSAAFLRRSARADGSWPIDTNLATWLTTLSIHALNAGRIDEALTVDDRRALRGWLLGQQTQEEHPYTGAAAGAWAWTDLPGGVPDADDTSGALLALRSLGVDETSVAAAARGVEWLLNLQNRDGGVPTFCRGWGALPFDRSGSDLTAHAIRAWLAWKPDLGAVLGRRIDGALRAAAAYLLCSQRADGAFLPLWFGNQQVLKDENPTYGTSRVLPALDAVAQHTSLDVAGAIARATAWLVRAQHADGGWGGDAGAPSSIEETSLAISALTGDRGLGIGDSGLGIRDRGLEGAREAAERGGEWLRQATRDGTVCPAAPIGFYFAKLWYYEQVYPVIFATEALERLRARADQRVDGTS